MPKWMKKQHRLILFHRHFGGLLWQWPRLVTVICIQPQVSLFLTSSRCHDKMKMTSLLRLGSIRRVCSSVLWYFMCGIADSFHFKCIWMWIQKGSNSVKIRREFKRWRRKYQPRVQNSLILVTSLTCQHLSSPTWVTIDDFWILVKTEVMYVPIWTTDGRIIWLGHCLTDNCPDN